MLFLHSIALFASVAGLVSGQTIDPSTVAESTRGMLSDRTRDLRLY